MQCNTNPIAKTTKHHQTLEKPTKKPKKNAFMGCTTPNFKNTNFQKLKFLKMGCRALPGSRALTPILNA